MTCSVNCSSTFKFWTWSLSSLSFWASGTAAWPAAPAPGSVAFSGRSSLACTNVAHSHQTSQLARLLPEFCVFRNFV
ncbi:hypothetical protein C8J57DRAFT_1386356, partial [Mycena rebaudengoi]